MVLTITAVLSFSFILVFFVLAIVNWKRMEFQQKAILLGMTGFFILFAMQDMINAGGWPEKLKSWEIPTTSIRLYFH